MVDSDLVEKMKEMRLRGATFEEIGKAFGHTRAWANKLLQDHGGPEVRALGRLGKRQARERRRVFVRQQVENFVKSNVGYTAKGVADSLGLPVAEVSVACAGLERFLGAEVGEAQPSDLPQKMAALAALREASELRSPLTTNAYRALARSRDVDWPSVSGILDLFGSWKKACGEAGVVCGKTRRASYESTWSDDQIVEFVARYLQDPASNGTLEGYRRWRDINAAEAPSADTLRKRFKAWRSLRNRALEWWRLREG